MLTKEKCGDYRDIPIVDSGEPLIPLIGLSPKITLYPYYFYHRVPFSIQACYLRAGAAQRLKQAASYLPDGIHFVVLDAWRPFEVQRALYEMIQDDLRRQYNEEEKVQTELAKFVAVPSNNIDRPSPHLTGGAIDLTLGSQNGWLNMGTEFDEFTEKAKANYYENLTTLTVEEQEIRENRRLLKKVMTQAGFTAYEEEWWHFDYGNQRWAMETQSVPIYRGIKKIP